MSLLSDILNLYIGLNKLYYIIFEIIIFEKIFYLVIVLQVDHI